MSENFEEKKAKEKKYKSNDAVKKLKSFMETHKISSNQPENIDILEQFRAISENAFYAMSDVKRDKNEASEANDLMAICTALYTLMKQHEYQNFQKLHEIQNLKNDGVQLMKEKREDLEMQEIAFLTDLASELGIEQKEDLKSSFEQFRKEANLADSDENLLTIINGKDEMIGKMQNFIDQFSGESDINNQISEIQKKIEQMQKANEFITKDMEIDTNDEDYVEKCRMKLENSYISLFEIKEKLNLPQNLSKADCMQNIVSKKDLEAAQQAVEEIKLENSKLSHPLELAQFSIVKKDTEIESLKQENASLKQELRGLKEDTQDSANDLDQTKFMLQNIQKNNDILTKTNEKQSKRIEELMQLNSEYEEQIQKLKEEAEALDFEHTKLSLVSDDYSSKIETLEKRLKESEILYKGKIGQLESVNNALEEQNNIQSDEIQKEKSLREKLFAIVLKQDQLFTKFDETTQELKEKVEKLQKENSDYEHELSKAKEVLEKEESGNNSNEMANTFSIATRFENVLSKIKSNIENTSGKGIPISLQKLLCNISQMLVSFIETSTIPDFLLKCTFSKEDDDFFDGDVEKVKREQKAEFHHLLSKYVDRIQQFLTENKCINSDDSYLFVFDQDYDPIKSYQMMQQFVDSFKDDVDEPSFSLITFGILNNALLLKYLKTLISAHEVIKTQLRTTTNLHQQTDSSSDSNTTISIEEINSEEHENDKEEKVGEQIPQIEYVSIITGSDEPYDQRVLDDLEKQIAQKAEDMNKISQEKEELQQQITDLNTEKQSLQEHIESLNTENAEVKKKSDELMSEFALLKETFENTNQQFTDAQNVLQQKIIELTQQLLDEKQKLEEVQETNKAETTNLQSTIQSLQSSVEAKTQRIRELETSKQKLTEENKKIQNEQNSLEAEHTKELFKLKEKQLNLTNQISALEIEKKIFESRANAERQKAERTKSMFDQQFRIKQISLEQQMKQERAAFTQEFNKKNQEFLSQICQVFKGYTPSFTTSATQSVMNAQSSKSLTNEDVLGMLQDISISIIQKDDPQNDELRRILKVTRNKQIKNAVLDLINKLKQEKDQNVTLQAQLSAAKRSLSITQNESWEDWCKNITVSIEPSSALLPAEEQKKLIEKHLQSESVLLQNSKFTDTLRFEKVLFVNQISEKMESTDEPKEVKVLNFMSQRNDKQSFHVIMKTVIGLMRLSKKKTFNKKVASITLSNM